MKKTVIIIITLVLLGGITWYFLFYKKNKSSDGTTSTGFKSFFPLGGNRGENTDEQITENPPTNSSSQIDVTSPFKQLSPRPIAGYTIFSQTKKTTFPSTEPKGKPTAQNITDYFVRYVARQSGYVYEIKNNEVPQQISNTFIPAIYEAFFADNNNSAIVRFLRDDGNTIGSYYIPIPQENLDGTRTQKEGVFLPDNIDSLVSAIDLKEIAYLIHDSSGGTVNISDPLGKNKKELIRSPIKEWLISWPQKNTLYLQTKPAGTVLGFLYKIDRDERRLRKVLGNVAGLTTSMSPSGSLVLYSESSSNKFSTKLLDTKTGITRNTGLSILPEKCTWLINEDLICAGNENIKPGAYPDVWYAGLVSFSDSLYRIYTKNNIFDVLYSGLDKSFDMTNLKIDEDRGLLYFIDKKTGLLWQFSL